MTEVIEKRSSAEPSDDGLKDEKVALGKVVTNEFSESAIQNIGHDLNATEDDLLEAKELAATFSLEDTRDIASRIHLLHKRDQNFPMSVLTKIEEFLGNEAIFENPEKHEAIIMEMKIEAALITNNSPYAEVRSVVDNHDDMNMPCSTIRAWVLGIFFSIAISFMNGFFEIRQPSILVYAQVPQLLSYPLGKLWDRTLPDWGFTLFGTRHSLNPGPFNKKEHMLITIMASIARGTPYTNYLVWMQFLPHMFNQPWAVNFGYQITIALSTNFIGYGIAGLCRRFLVYPSFCVWPSSLVTVALNQAFHTEENIPVEGPMKKIWRWSRIKFFSIMFTAMFVYFWFPNYIFTAMSYFNWMTWIAPDNANLATITGSITGLGLNPFPTLDWNVFIFHIDPLVVPSFTTFNGAIGALGALCLIAAIWYSNANFSQYLPINSNLPFDNTGASYNITAIIDDRGLLDEAKYQAYSPPYLSAGNTVIYMSYFGIYTASITYGLLYHWAEVSLGMRDLISSFRPSKREEVEKGRVLDVHNRLMKKYKEVPEWWFMICLVLAIAVGAAGIGYWPTQTSPAVVLYGVALALIFVVPLGIIYAMTGFEVTLNVLAEFIGGAFVPGNALSMCFFKTYGYITCSHALHFSQDLKLAHYTKLPPRVTFFAQMVPTLISTFVCCAILQYQIHLEGVCTPDAPFRFYCPAVTSYFTAAVLWGTVGPKKLWGPGGQYAPTLVGFPLGIALVVIMWAIGNKYPRNKVIRSAHPVMWFFGGLVWAPFNLTYLMPAVPVAWFSWVYLKNRYVGLWSKYNFVLSAAFSSAIAISALIQFFSVSITEQEIAWWGNEVPFAGCDGLGTCGVKPLPEGQAYFGPGPGNYN